MATEHRFDVEGIERAVLDGVSRSLDTIAIELQSTMRRMLSKAGTGRQYRKHKGRGRRARNMREKGIHVASRPGQPPAADTGLLRNSWAVGGRDNALDRSRQRDRRRPTLSLGSAVVYAEWLDTGTAKMAARPYIQPSIDELAKSGKIERIVARGVTTAIVAHLGRPRP